ncbi:MAG: DUF3179 domain-containing protein, partial [Bacteroidetes bacterium]|nr:DUF3179 domain-containing protein [Bacteroidota bacterium]
MQTMMPPFVLLLVLCAVLVAACDRPPGDASSSEDESAAERPARPVAIEQGKFFERDGTRYLWGGEDPEQHFVVDNLILEPEQFHYGIGREHFPALIEPAFVAAEAADAWLPDTARVLGLQVGDDVRAYPIDLLIRHEVVNDVVGGEPVFAAYCILADLGAVYDRRIDGRVHTFALSGYTYYDPEVWDGMDGFVLWDRETESLWWPLIGKAVSGPMLHTPLPVYDEDRWTQTTWGAWKAQHPEAQVLEPGQDVEPPASWPQ